MYTAFTVTVDAREGISTGISASDRARTLRMLADPATQPADLRRPGHICPLRYALLPTTFCKMANAVVGKEYIGAVRFLEEQGQRDKTHA